jgi:hypothetical protein
MLIERPRAPHNPAFVPSEPHSGIPMNIKREKNPTSNKANGE